MAGEPKDLGPATPSLAHERQAEAVQVIRDVLGGTMHLRKIARSSGKYLLRFEKEKDSVYHRRVDSAVLFGALERTISAFSGLVFRKDPLFGEDVPDEIQTHADNIDLTGRSLATFLRDHFEDAVADGHAGIFVDMQPPAEVNSRAEELAAGLRPYWINVRKQDIVAASTANIGGRVLLDGLRFRQTSVRENGRWGQIEVHRIREYWLSVNPENESQIRCFYNVWELDAEKEYPGESADDWRVIEGWDSASPGGMMAISRIPLSVTYTGREGIMESRPPLLNLALQNIRHFQNDSDNENLARTTKVQTLVFTGESEERIKAVSVGPGHALVLEDPDADAKWIGADGSSFSDFVDDLQNVERRMGIMGASVLHSESRAPETAQSKRIDKVESDSQLAKWAKELQRSTNEALSLHAEWLDLEDGGHIGINTDFDTEPLDSGVFKEFRELWAERGISWETLMRIAEKGEALPDGFDLEEERERIATEDVDRLDRQTAAMFGGDGGDDA